MHGGLGALHALTLNLWSPGNPTFASAEPSTRYSPFYGRRGSACELARPGGMEFALRVRRTAKLGHGAGLCQLIRIVGSAVARSERLGVQLSAGAAELGDRQAGWESRLSILPIAGSIGLLGIATLDHETTGAFGIAGLFLLALFSPAGRRQSSILAAGVVAAGAALLCSAWPWYSFWAAVKSRQDPGFWFIPNITRNHSGAVRDPAARSSAGAPRMWFAELWSNPRESACSWLRMTLVIALAYCLVPQLIDIAREPHLARTCLLAFCTFEILRKTCERSTPICSRRSKHATPFFPTRTPCGSSRHFAAGW
jgi:hypothetical protein